MASVPLSDLVSRAVTRTYADFSARLSAMSALPDGPRKAALLDLLLSLRHRLVRLLAALRWARAHAALTQRADVAESAAVLRDQALEDVADALWDARHAAAAAAAPKPALAQALDVLATGALARFHKAHAVPPKHPATPTLAASRPASLPVHAAPAHALTPPMPARDKKPLLTTELSDVTQDPASPYLARTASTLRKPFALRSAPPSVADRVALATRNCVRESLLHVGALQVLQWRAGPAMLCVDVGVPNLWHAHLALDSPDPDLALLRVHHIHVAVASHPDAPADPRQSPAEQRPQPPTDVQNALLRRAADDRIAAAVQAARAIAKGSLTFNPTCVMLCALRDMMVDDVCAPLAMDYLRAQARALADAAWKGTLKVQGAEVDAAPGTPLAIQYWVGHPASARISVSEMRAAAVSPKLDASPIRSDENDTMDSVPADVSLERRPGCVNCTHDPALPSAIEMGGSHTLFELTMNALNIEDLLLAAIKLRSRARLKHLCEGVLNKCDTFRIPPACVTLLQPRKAHTAGDRNRTALIEDVLRIQLEPDGSAGVDFRIFDMTGGVYVRPYGAAALVSDVEKSPDSIVWKGTKNFADPNAELDAVLIALETIRARLKLNAASRSVCALDAGVSCTLPPGTASVAAMASFERAASQLVPPFAPLERRNPRRFLTLSPPPPNRNILHIIQNGATPHAHARTRTSSQRGVDRGGSAKRPRLTYATTSDALVFIQESVLAGEQWLIGTPRSSAQSPLPMSRLNRSEKEPIDRYGGTAAAAAAWAVTREVVERRLRRDSLLRAFVAANVASAAQTHHPRITEEGDLRLESASRVLLKVKCEPLPVQRAELLLRGFDAWQVRLSLLPRIFDSTDPQSFSHDESSASSDNAGRYGNLWSVGVACTGSVLTFTYPSANASSVRSFFRDLTRARTAAALARGVPPSPYYRVLRRSPVRIVVGLGPYGRKKTGLAKSENGFPTDASKKEEPPKPQYTAMVEYVYSKGNSGGFSLSFSPSKPTMEELAPLIEEALDASGGQVGGILAGLLERACPVAAAAESAVRQRVSGRIRFVTALRVRAVFLVNRKSGTKDASMAQQGTNRTNPVPQAVPQAGPQGGPQVYHAVDVDARGGSGLVTVIDVGRATVVMIQQGFASRSGPSGGNNPNWRNDFAPLPKWDDIVDELTKEGYAEAQRAGSTVVLKMEVLEQFLSDLVTAALG